MGRRLVRGEPALHQQVRLACCDPAQGIPQLALSDDALVGVAPARRPPVLQRNGNRVVCLFVVGLSVLVE
jgi:hypothetical protein